MGFAPWLEEVWVNYISNGLKYGGRAAQGIPPRLEMGFDMMAGAEHPDFVRCWIRDSGQGISQEQQSRLFVPFERANPSITGHGLGLSIVRRMIEKLGGKVGVQSAEGQGSTFFFTLPAAPEQNNP
jgi:two-component system, sensor histidine kinase and response regulator